MSDTYTKLFRSIAASTIVSEPVATRWLWVTMLSQADKAGKVYASVPGLARIANISIAEVEAGIECFLSPDTYSRTTENEGRRIELFDGGWRLLNHAKYDAMRNEAERREKKREWDRTNRPSGHQRSTAKAVKSESGQSASSPPQSAETRQSGPISHISYLISQEDQKQEHVQPMAARSRFDYFWQTYPNKKSRQEAEKSWRKQKLDARCDDLISHVLLMIATDDDWRRGFVPMGSTYLNQARWEDVPKRPPSAGPPNGAPVMGKQMQGLMALEAMKSGNRMVAGRDSERAAKTVLLIAGSDASG
jgi:hypothetical protein